MHRVLPRESDQIIADFPKMVLSPGGEFAHDFKAHRGAFAAFPKKMTNARGEWARLKLTEP